MREILFKGKRKDNGEWVYGFLSITTICGGNGSYLSYVIYEKPTEVFTGNWYEVDPETVSQYTGLTDCKENKIFEGDIIRFADYDEYECYLESLKYPEEYEGVSFKNLWTVDDITYGIKIDYPAFDLNHNDFECNGLAELKCAGIYYYEIIGNIYDNPELIKQRRDNNENF